MHTGLTRQQVSDPVGVISRLPQCLLPPRLKMPPVKWDMIYEYQPALTSTWPSCLFCSAAWQHLHRLHEYMQQTCPSLFFISHKFTPKFYRACQLGWILIMLRRHTIRNDNCHNHQTPADKMVPPSIWQGQVGVYSNFFIYLFFSII